jgi:NAD-dependent DNA ligase
VAESERTYKELLNEFGGKPTWAKKLSDRAAHALVRGGWTSEKIKTASVETLAAIPNIGRNVALEISKVFH